MLTEGEYWIMRLWFLGFEVLTAVVMKGPVFWDITLHISDFLFHCQWNWEPRHLSRYSDWLLAGRPRGRSSSPGGSKNFNFSMWSRPALRPTQPPIQWVPGVLPPGAKRPRREADHSPPTSVEVKKMWVYTSTPPYVFMTYCLIS
jgi:hypothetical protein